MPMNSHWLKEATEAAEAFLKAAKEGRPDVHDGYGNSSNCIGTSKTATIRRKSMDLTRALATLRKSRL